MNKNNSLILIGLLFMSMGVSAQENQSNDFFGSLISGFAKTINNMFEPPEKEEVKQISYKAVERELVAPSQPSKSDLGDLIALEDSFNAFPLTEEDKIFLNERFGENFVAQIDVKFQNGSTLETWIIKEGDEVRVTSEGYSGEVTETLHVPFSLIKKAISDGSFSVVDGTIMLLSGQIHVRPTFVPTIFDLQNMPSFKTMGGN